MFVILRLFINLIDCKLKTQLQNKARISKTDQMQRNESEPQNVEKEDETIVHKKDDQVQKMESKTSSIKMESENPSPSQSEDPSSQKYQQQVKNQILEKQAKIETSLANISIQSPVKRLPLKTETKINEKTKITPGKTSGKFDNYSKEKLQDEAISNSKLHSDSHMKSPVRSNQKVKKINKPFYEETYYITGMKENYLLLLSDTNQVLEFPIGMFTTQVEIPDPQNPSEQGNQNQNFHLIKDIKIGQPIKIKLELDFLRQEKDDRIFNSLQRSINEEYSYGDEEPNDTKNKEISLKKNK